MFTLTFLLAVVAAEPAREFTTPKSAEAEQGHGLTAREAGEGWISLFDGQTTYGWESARVADGVLRGGATTSLFGPAEIRLAAAAGGELKIGEVVLRAEPGTSQFKIDPARSAPIRLGEGLRIKSIILRPLELKSLFDGKSLDGWTVLKHPRLPDDRQAKWSIEGGALRGLGGPGAVEAAGRYGNLVLQLEIRTKRPLTNGGVFFRAIPGDFMNGYEAQVFNACYDRDPAQPARYSTGALDDRQLARRLVSRDEQPFVMTIVAAGPHIATWVNGYQTTDWTDDRAPHENPRQGRRLEAGAIQLQAHDGETDVEFRSVRIAELP
jgi:hypothetical protein